MFTQQLVNGLLLGGIYALLALGYTMVYGILKFINFAHGDVFMWGAFAGLFFSQLGLSFPIVIVLTAISTAALGILVERIAYMPLRNASRLVVTTSALGMSIVLQNLALLLIGADTHPIPNVLKIRNIPLWGGANITNMNIIILVTTVFLMAALNWFVNKTRMGKAMRAVSEDAKVAGLMGINRDRTILLVFGIGSALAGVGGLMSGITYDAVWPTMGYAAGLKAFTAAVLGGIGSIPGAMVGGFVLGLVETFGAAYVSSDWRDAIAFIILIVLLMFKPSGLFKAEIYTKKA